MSSACLRYSVASSVFLYAVLLKPTLFLYFNSKCGPRLSEEAAQMLKNRYVLMRSGARDYEKDAEKKINIPITVRYAFQLYLVEVDL